MEPHNSQAITDEQLKALRDELYAKYRLYNEEYFGGHLPYLPILLRDKCYVDGHEAWGRFDCKATYSKITRRIMDIQDRGSITILTKYVRPSNTNHYLQTLLHEMIHAYILLVLKRYPRDPHGELFMKYANDINAREGLDIQPENELVTGDEVGDDNNVNANTENQVDDNAYGNLNNPDDSMILRVFVDRGDSPFKIWALRCPRNLVDLYRRRISNAFRGKDITIAYDPCQIPGFERMPEDPNKLPGFGANDLPEMCRKLGGFCGVDPELFERYFRR